MPIFMDTLKRTFISNHHKGMLRLKLAMFASQSSLYMGSSRLEDNETKNSAQNYLPSEIPK